MTNHALVKKKIIANNDAAADCSCNELETQWHVMGMGSCSSYPLITQRFAQLREGMMKEVGIPSNIQKANVDNHEPNAEVINPDWADKECVFKHREFKIVKLLERHCNAVIHWLSWITDGEGMLGVDEKQAKKFSKE
jgi:hypothetical protein